MATQPPTEQSLLEAGALFVVTTDGARLDGWVPVRHGYTGASIDLDDGDIIECRGFGPGMGSDPGYGYHFDPPPEKGAPPGFCFGVFRPSVGGIWKYGQPLDDALEYLS